MELMKQERPAELIREDSGYMSAIMQMASSPNLDADKLAKLMDLQERWEANQAKKAFNGSMQRAQAKMRRIGTDAANPQTKSKYASYAKLDGALRPLYTEEGFALSFDSGEPPAADMVRVICYLSHIGGHTQAYRIDMPADGKGAKGGDVMTKTHATGAAMSYGMRYLLKMIFNVAVGDTDDDGNGASGAGMSQEEFDRYIGLIENAPTLDALKQKYFAALKDANDAKDPGAARSFTDAKEKRKKELA